MREISQVPECVHRCLRLSRCLRHGKLLGFRRHAQYYSSEMPLTFTDVLSSFNAHTPCFYLLGSNLIVLIASGMNCTAWGTCKEEDAWAVACAAISSALTLFFTVTSLFSDGRYSQQRDLT